MSSLSLTKQEKHWIFYDIGNSAFTLLITTIMPIYFNSLAENAGLSSVDYLAYWGYAASIATLAVALIGPICGTLSDTRGYKRPIFVIFLAIGLVGCVSLGFFDSWWLFLVVFIIARIGYSASLIFYDSMLSDVTTPERMDYVSANGYAWGYIGSCAPFVVSLGLVLGGGAIGLGTGTAMHLAFWITALWWLAFTVPLLRSYTQHHFIERPKHVVGDSFARLAQTFRNIRGEKKIFLFLIAFFFYIDGVYTIIDMATAYGAALGLDSTGLLLALLVTQIVAFPCAIIFGRLAQRFATAKLITVCIVAYFGIAVFAIFLQSQWQFWLLAIFVGMFQGGIQALSRSYFTKIIPAKQSGEYFGLMDICGKGASFMGTTLVSLISQLTGSINTGVGMISLLFLVGLFFFRLTVRTR
ncbi:MAG: MFS transporter [Peptococcaceae bacterium]|nr:MFS transporter [Peptococcaceae bacterium]